MSTQVVTFPLQFKQNNRFAERNKDAKLINVYVETEGESFNFTVKRPGFNIRDEYPDFLAETELDPTTEARGIYRRGSDIYAVWGPYVLKNGEEIFEIEDESEGTVYFSDFDNDTWLFKTNKGLYFVDADADAVTQVNDNDYPDTTVPGLVVLNSAVYVMNEESEIYNSDSDSFSDWDALNFLTAEAESDTAVAIHKQRDMIIAFGSRSIEFFFDAGQEPPGSPLQPQRNSFLRTGCPSPDSIVNTENSSLFIAEDPEGHRFVAAILGTQVAPVSTVSEDRILSREEDLSTAYAWVGEEDGHKFYILNLSNTTLVYDITEGTWYEWQTDCERLLGRHSVKVNELTVVQDDDLVLYNFSGQYGTDDQKAIEMTIVTPEFGGTDSDVDFGMKNKVLSRVELVADFTGEGKVWLSWSDDNYKTWSRPRCFNLHKRDFLTRCGRFQRRAFRLQTEFPNLVRFRSLEMNLDVGTYGR